MSKVARSVTSVIDPKNPLIKNLGKVFGGFLPGTRSPQKGLRPRIPTGVNKKGDAPRVDVVGSELCGSYQDPLSVRLRITDQLS